MKRTAFLYTVSSLVGTGMALLVVRGMIAGEVSAVVGVTSLIILLSYTAVVLAGLVPVIRALLASRSGESRCLCATNVTRCPNHPFT